MSTVTLSSPLARTSFPAFWKTAPGRVVPVLAALAATVLVWQLGTTISGIDPTILPSPVQVFASAWNDRVALGQAAWISSRETLIGMVLAVVVALLISVAIESSAVLKASVYPLLIGSQTIPVVAIAPLVVIWFGFGEQAKVLLVAMYAFFPIVVGLVGGMEATPAEQTDLMHTIGLRRWQVLLRVKLPAALPRFFSGVRIAATYALGTAVVAEFLGAYNGLGVYLIGAKSSFRIDLVFAGAVTTVVLTLALYGLCMCLEWLALPWQRYQRKGGRR
jgi:ABC-type nitrate/sulfonate/bicarbonate transport system permease component